MVSCEGRDVTIVSYGVLINEALYAAELLWEHGISAEVLKLNTIAPLDTDAVASSVTKTGKLVVVEDCVENGCVGERLAAELDKMGKAPETLILKNLGNQFTPQGKVEMLRAAAGIDSKGIFASVTEVVEHGKEKT